MMPVWVVAVGLLVYGVVRYAGLAWRLWRWRLTVFLVGLALILLGGVLIELVTVNLHLAQSVEYVEIGIEETMELLGGSLTMFAAASVLLPVFGDLVRRIPGGRSVGVVDGAPKRCLAEGDASADGPARHALVLRIGGGCTIGAQLEDCRSRR